MPKKKLLKSKSSKKGIMSYTLTELKQDRSCVTMINREKLQGIVPHSCGAGDGN